MQKTKEESYKIRKEDKEIKMNEQKKLPVQFWIDNCDLEDNAFQDLYQELMISLND